MAKYIIYLEGSISSGKSTLLPRIANALRTMCNTNIYEYPEPLHIWNEIKKCDKPLLQLLYEHPNQYATTFQYLTLITRQTQYLEFFPMLKDQKKVEQDEIWKKICRELDWDFIPTI